jgi:glycosyltransferase involved in cell wall biosynthesis
MEVLYYTSFSFLDIALEMINSLKSQAKLHVLITVRRDSYLGRKSRIDKKRFHYVIESPQEYLNDEGLLHLQPYFEGCASVNFVVYENQSNFSPRIVKLWFRTWWFIKKISYDVLIVEDFTLRDLQIYWLLFFNANNYIIIHDAIPHKGENDWKNLISNYLLFKVPFRKNYLFYSGFTVKQFEENIKNGKAKKILLKMHPYTFYQSYMKEGSEEYKHILFFGRFSYYKGIEVLLDAMNLVCQDYPDEHLVIAGRNVPGYQINQEKLNSIEFGYTLLNQYIPTQELVPLIQESKFVICPYMEASQSGVLMTAFALNIPVIATDVGAFPEFIKQNITGVLIDPNDPLKLAAAIKWALKDHYYKQMSKNIQKENECCVADNAKLLMESFQMLNK